MWQSRCHRALFNVSHTALNTLETDACPRQQQLFAINPAQVFLMLLVAHCMPQVSSYINAYPSFFCLLTVPQQQIFLYLLFSASLTDKRLNIHLCSYLCLSSEPTLVLESLPGSTTHGKQTAPAERARRREGEREREREREEVWWTDADADTSAGRSSSVQIRWWERRVQEKEGKGGGNAKLHWYEDDAGAV